MEQLNNLQQVFLTQIKQKQPTNISLVDEIADKLNLSNDSAYRRIRCEQDFTFSEMSILSRAYDISLDSLIDNQPSDVTFSYRSLSNEGFTLEKYLESIAENLKLLNGFTGEKKLIYLTKDFPIFHYFDFPVIASFKMFFWLKFILNDPEFKDKEFTLDAVSEEIMQAGKQVLYQYNKVPSIEIWNKMIINSTLNQIEYFFESGLFSKNEDALLVLDDLNRMVHHIKSIAENGIKYNYQGKQLNVESNFKLYFNEVTIGDNTIFFKLGDQRMSFITAGVLNILASSNHKFCNDIENMMNNIMRKSIEISSSSQKIRTKFFKIQTEKIEMTRRVLRGA